MATGFTTLLKLLTWGLSVIGEVRDEKGLSVHDHDVVGGNVVRSRKGSELLRPGVAEVWGYSDVTEVDLKQEKCICFIY